MRDFVKSFDAFEGCVLWFWCKLLSISTVEDSDLFRKGFRRFRRGLVIFRRISY